MKHLIYRRPFYGRKSSFSCFISCFLFLLCGAFVTPLGATALSGTYSICSSGCDYSSIAAAITDLNNNGISGPVTFNVSAGTYSGTATLNAISASSATNTVTFAGAGMYSTVWQDISTPLTVNYAQYVTFKNITFKCTSSLYQGVYMNYAANISFSHCRFIAPDYGSSPSGTPYCIKAYYLNNCTFDANRFEGGFYSFYHYGYNTSGYGNNIFTNNRIVSFGPASIYEYGYGQSGNIFSNNSFDSGVYNGRHYAIAITFDNAVTIKGNTLRDAGMYVNELNYTDRFSHSIISNNMISGDNGTNASAFVATVDSGNVLIAHNTIYVPASYSIYCGVQIMSSGGNVSVLDNIFDIEATSSVNGNITIGTSTSGFSRLDANDYYTGTSGKLNKVSLFGTSYDSFPKLIPAVAGYGFEKHAVNVRPVYVNAPADLHLDKSYSNPNGIYAGINYDIDSDARCILYPSMGADESNYDKKIKPSPQVIKGPSKIHDSSLVIFTDSSGISSNTKYRWYLDGKYEGDSVALRTASVKAPSATVSLVTENCIGKDSSYRTFIVSKVLPDTIPPNLEVAGPDTLYLAAKNDSTAFGLPQKVLKSVDLVDGTVPYTINPAKIPLNTPDTILVKYASSDQSGNQAIAYRWVIVYDSSRPVLVLKGNAHVKVEVNTSYTDAGVDPADYFFDAQQLSALIVMSGSVNIHKVGTYMLTYNLTNPYGLKATPVIRTVDVIDTIAPIIKLNGPAKDSVEVNEPYNDPGATAKDNYYSGVSLLKGGSFYTLFSSGTPSRLGTYTAVYTAEDSSGNKTSISRSIKVFDSVAPVVILKGPAVDTVCRWATFSDSGYIVTDNYYKILAIDTEGSYKNTSLPGLYKFRYKATDSSGNIGYSAYRYVYVRSEEDNECKSGIKDGLSLDKYIRIYPNPTTAILNIQADLADNGPMTIRLTNILGEEISVNTTRLSNNTFSIDLGGQAAGVYLLDITSSRDKITRQIILNK